MIEIITTSDERIRAFFSSIERMHSHIEMLSKTSRPILNGERYLGGDEVMKFLHISPRTLQNLRDKRLISYTTIGGKMLYSEQELQQVLFDNYRPIESPF